MSEKLLDELQEVDQEELESREEDSEFGECENCGCTLNYLPSGSWGVGYVCIPCAKELRGEYE